MFAILILFLLVRPRARAELADHPRALRGARGARLGAVPDATATPERFRDKVGVLVPAYNEADNIAWVLDRIPTEVCGEPTAVLVVDDGSRDGTAEVAAEHGAVVARHVINRGGGAALRTGYRLLADSEANIVVTLDADGQHLPSEMERLVEPVLSGEVAMAHGSRVLGEAEPNHRARELGIVFFNRVVSLITRTKVSDCSNGYRAVRADVLPQLVLRQEQFHTSEFLIEAIKRGIPAKEVPVTVVRRLSRPLEEAGRGPLRDGLRERDRQDLAALAPPRLARGRDRPGGADLRRVGQVQVLAADAADLHVELLDLAAARAAPLGLLRLRPVEDHGDQAEQRQHDADQEPDEERAPLGAADDPGGDAERAPIT